MNFEEQLKTIYPELLRYSRGLAGSISDGDDLLQESLIKAWRNYSNLKDNNSFKFWMIRIVRNTYRSWISRKKMVQLLSLDSVEELPSMDNNSFEEREVLRLSLNKLPFKQREAVILYEINGYSIAEIERIQNSKESAVKSRLSRGRKKLRFVYLEMTER